MVCERCGGEVIWKGPLVALTHTECKRCGAINSQVTEDEPEEEASRICRECGAEMDRFEDRDGGGWACPNFECGCIETDEMEAGHE